MRFLAWLGCLFLVPTLANPGRAQPVARDVPVLVYHRFAERAVDTMTVRTETIRAHLRFLENNGYGIVPLDGPVPAIVRRQRVPSERAVAEVAQRGRSCLG